MAGRLRNLLLIRHGLTDWNETGRLLGRSEIGLNPRGRAQADRLAAALAEVPLGRLLCSPRRRTRETAAAVAMPHGCGVEIEPALDEVWLGRWQGRTIDEIGDDPDLRRYIDDPTHVCDAVESIAAVQERIVGVVERLRREASEETIAIVSHGDPLRALLVSALSMDLRMLRRLAVSPGSVSVLRLGSRGPRLLTMNARPAPGAIGEILGTR
jgi:probable phosphoglycerate mutase